FRPSRTFIVCSDRVKVWAAVRSARAVAKRSAITFNRTATTIATIEATSALAVKRVLRLEATSPIVSGVASRYTLKLTIAAITSMRSVQSHEVGLSSGGGVAIATEDIIDSIGK